MPDITAINQDNLEFFRALLPAEPDTEHTILLGSMQENEPTGVLMAHKEEQSLSLDWLYVRKACRGKGAGKALLKTLINAVQDLHFDMIFFNLTETEELLRVKPFFKALGFIEEEESVGNVMVCALGDVDDTIFPEDLLTYNAPIPLKSATTKVLSLMADALREDFGKSYTPERLHQSFNREFSFYRLLSDGRCSFVLVRTDKNSLTISYLKDQEPNDPRGVLRLIYAVYQKALEKNLPQSTLIYAAAVKRSVSDFYHKAAMGRVMDRGPIKSMYLPFGSGTSFEEALLFPAGI